MNEKNLYLVQKEIYLNKSKDLFFLVYNKKIDIIYFPNVKNLIIVFISNLDKITIIADIDKNGPYGISCDEFLCNIISDIGRPINADIKIDTIVIGNPKVKPKTAINFISPPPIDSFLNKKSPNNFSKNININAASPFNSDIPTPLNPTIKNFIIIINNEKTINTLSGIVIV